MNRNIIPNVRARKKFQNRNVFKRPFLLLLMGLFAIATTVPSIFATSADFKTTDWAAAAPFTYNHSTGGGAYNDRTVGDFNDVTEQLEGGEFTCGDTVTYLAQLTMEDVVDEADQSARMTFSFLANSTGQAGAALAEILDAQINYGVVENGDDYTGANPGIGGFGYDSGISDDRQAFDGVNVIDPAGTGANAQNGSTLTIISTGLIDANGDTLINDDDLFLSNSELLLTIEIDDLEAGETVVARIDVLLRCQPGSSPTGNLQGKLDDVIALPSNESASSGAQTLPFLKVGELEGAGDPLLDLSKTVAPAGGSFDDSVEELTVDEGDTVRYYYEVTNSGTAPFFDLTIEDDNGTPADTSDDFFVDTTNNVWDVLTVEGFSIDPGLDGLYGTADDVDPGPDGLFGTADDNPGENRVIDSGGQSDDGPIYGDLDGAGDAPDAASGVTVIYYADVTLSEPGTVVNTAEATVLDSDSNNAGTLIDTDTATVIVQDVLPTATLTKTADPLEVTEPGGNVNFTVVVQNTSTVDALTLSVLNDDIYGDIADASNTNIVSTTCSLNQTLDPDDSAPGGADEYSCSFVAAVSGVAGSSHVNVVTATLADDEGNVINPFDDATVGIIAPSVVEPEARVIKGNVEGNDTVATLDEPGGSVTIDVEVFNDAPAGTGDATLTTLVDDIYGDITTTGHDGITATTCATGGVIVGGDSYTCSFDVDVDSQPVTIIDIVTATLTNAAGSDSDDDQANVIVNDVLPTVDIIKTAVPQTLAEPGGDFVFTLDIINLSAEEVTITSLTDDYALSQECQDLVGTTLAANDGAPGGADETSCSYTVTHTETGNYDNTATVEVTDDDGSTGDDSDDETVTVTDTPPTVDIIKTAVPQTLAEPGGEFVFTLDIINLSAEEVTITSLTDDYALSQECQDLVGTTLAANDGAPGGADETSCSYTVTHTDAGSYDNTATVEVTDDDGGTGDDSDDETVTVTDTPPTVDIIKTAVPQTLAEPGGEFVFTLDIINLSAEEVTITSLTDDYALSQECQDLIGTTLAANDGAPGGADETSCSYTVTHTDAGSYDNTATVEVTDDDGGTGTDSDDETVTVTDTLPDVTVLKTAVGAPASVPETGGDVTFTYQVTNNSDEAGTISSLEDDQFGTLTGDADCQVGTVLAGGASCSFEATFSIPAGNAGETHTNVFTGEVCDDENNCDSDDEDEDVDYEDVLPDITVVKTAAGAPASVPETGGDVTFTYQVTNNSDEAGTINSLGDDQFGSLSGNEDCQVGTELAGGASCSFEATFSIPAGNAGETHTNIFTGEVCDDDDLDGDGEPNCDSDDEDEDVDYDDVLPDITVLKTAVGAPASVPETGGDVTFTYQVTNNSDEAGTISSLEDDQFGTLTGDADCQVGTELAGGASCSFEATFSIPAGNAGETHTNVFTGEVCDDENNCDSDNEDEDVDYDDVLPDVTVLKTADVQQVPETGGDVTFTFDVTNNNSEATTINSLTDTVFGTLAGDADCQVGTVLAGNGGTCSFEATFNLSADDLVTHTNTFTGQVCDNDDNCDDDSDDEEVTFEDVLPDVGIEKTAVPTSVQEPGGDVEFTIVVTNNSLEDATIDSLTDSDFDLSERCSDAVNTVLGYLETYTCTFTEFIAGNVGEDHNNVATVVASDNEGNEDTEDDDADVTITNATPMVAVEKDGPATIDEGGDDATYDITITNNSVSTDPLTITSINDDMFGDLLAEAEADWVTAGNAAPIVLASGDSFTFDITRNLTLNVGETHVNVVTVVGEDDEGTEATDNDDHTVGADNVAPAVNVAKSGEETIDEGGDTATYDITITNNSVSTDPLTITSLIDDRFGDLLPEAEAAWVGQGNIAPIVLQSGQGFSFEFDRDLTLNADETHTNIVTVIGTDDEGDTATDDDDHVVTAVNVDPIINIEKDGETIIDEGGDTATYNFTITNNSVSTDPLTITSLTDDMFGDLLPEAESANGGTIVLNPGESFNFSIDRDLTLNASETHTNQVFVIGVDDEGDEAGDDDDHVVEAENVAPVIDVDKTADQIEVFDPGEDVTFTVVIDNNSVSTDPVTIDSLVDDIHGDLNGQGDCAVPVVIQPGDSYTCSFVGFVDSDETDTITASGTDDEGTPVSDSDSAYVEMINPAISIEKSTGPADADTPPGPEILFGETVNWFYQVENIGDVTLTNLTVTDDQGVTVTCPIDTLPAGATTVCEGTGIAIVGQYANIGTVTASHTDADGDTANRSDDDPSHYFGATPSVNIEKTFADDHIIAGGDSGTFNLVVTNNGNVDLVNISVFDLVNDDLEVIGVAATAGSDADSDGNDQTVEWLIGSLGVDQSVTITVEFEADPSVPETFDVPNEATASSVYEDDFGNELPVSDTDDDLIDILVNFELRLEKLFDPTAVPQGTVNTFTIEVSNLTTDGAESDAVGVQVTDLVHDSLEVLNVTLTSGDGDCSDSVDQLVDCTVNIPIDTSILITVEYMTAPFATEDSPYDTISGDDFRFVFLNGSVLEGSTNGGPVFLDGVDITDDITIVNGLTKNEILFDPPGADPAFELHLSCSDPFTGGWGQAGGPVEGVDDNWQIAFFTIARYNSQGFLKACGNVINDFVVPNTADAFGTDSFDDETATDTTEVTVQPGITLDRLQLKGKRLTVRLTNYTGEPKEIDNISIVWPNGSGDLSRVWITVGNSSEVIWSGSDNPTDAFLDSTDSGWNGGTLEMGEAILRFDFKNKTASGNYVVRVNFTDGTFLDINP